METVQTVTLNTLAILLLVPWSVVTATFVEHEVDKNTDEYFAMECHFQNVSNDDSLQFLREGVYFPTPTGGVSFDGVFIIADGDTLHDGLSDEEYVVILIHADQDSSANYTLNITKLKPGNTGNISCVHSSSEGIVIHKETTSLVVRGAVVEFAQQLGVDEGSMEEWPAEEQHFNTSVEAHYLVRVDLVFSSFVPAMEVFTATDEESNRTPLISKSDPSVTITNNTLDEDSPVISITQSVIFIYEMNLNYTHNGKTLFAIVEQPTGEPALKNSFPMNVSYVPVLLGCKSEKVSALIGTKASLTCTLSANPEADIWWLRGSPGTLIQNKGRFSIEKTVTGDQMTSTLTISKVTQDDYGVYHIQGANVNGQSAKAAKKSDVIELTEKSGASMADPTMAIIAVITSGLMAVTRS